VKFSIFYISPLEKSQAIGTSPSPSLRFRL
jgi:hypothetical protein